MDKEPFFTDESSSSGEEVKNLFSHQKHKKSVKEAAQFRDGSPSLLLAFSTITSRSSPVSRQEEEEEEEEDSDQPIEEWMILGGEEQEGDSTIQLNLSYWNNSEDSSADEVIKSKESAWAVSEKDKTLPLRYWLPAKSQICNNCNREGHLARSCYYHKKRPVCILCGVMGHIQWDCPGRPCPSCGLPPHGSRLCERPPVWNQHCQRCGIVGHLSDICPDLWRQYHLTIQLEAPVRPSTVHTLQKKKCRPYCYNCSKRGHYGFECTKKISGTFPSLPYVCHYDTIDDILNNHTKDLRGTKELRRSGSSLLSQQKSEPAQDCGEESHSVKERSWTKQESCTQAARKKTWPERRRERREVKRLRREAQARREGGLFGRSRRNYDEEVFLSDPFRSPLLEQRRTPPLPLKKNKRDEASGRRSRKSREAERWKKRGGLKHGDLYPYGDIDIRSENLLSPKQRVRHRRK